MKNWSVRGCCAALAAVALLMPMSAFAQGRGGSWGHGGSGHHGGGHDYGSHYYRRDSHNHRGSASSFGLWIGPGWNSWWWDPWMSSGPYYQPYYRPYRPYYQPEPYQYYTYPNRYPAPPPVATPPPGYEEQAPEPQQERSSWYYCPDPQGYYPYVRECPKGWTKVAPRPESTPPPAAEPQNPPAPDRGGPVPYEYRWYYCQDPPGYYPHIRDCPTGWTTSRPPLPPLPPPPPPPQ